MAHFHSYVSRYRDNREDDSKQEPDTTKPDVKDGKTQQDCFPCPHCERRFTCKQGLERHMHIHNKKQTIEGTVQPDSSCQTGIQTTEGRHPCNYCTKVFNSLINRQRHERRFHEVQPEVMHDENTPVEINISSQQELETGQVGQYVLDISSNISENLSFFIDGKLVSASTVHETAEASALVGVDALILNPIQINEKEPELVTARFKRRTSTPQQDEEKPDSDECNFSTEPIENHNYACIEHAANEKAEPVEAMKELATEGNKPLVIGGNSCNQKPLDLSNTVKRSEDVALANAVLDLSMQKKSSEDCEQATAVISNVNESIENTEEQNANLAPLVTDFAIVSGSDLVTPVDQVTEGIVYGLIPTNGLSTSPTSLAPVTLQPASPCAIAFASPAPHAVLPTSPSLITVLAPPALPTQSNQPIQVLAPNLSTEPLVICTDNGLSADLTSAITAANSANLVALTQPIDPTLNIPGHVFLADPMALNPPLVDSTPSALNELNSFNIASNTVLIECTLSLEAAGNVVPAAIALQENQMEQQTQVLVNHIEQQQIVSVPSPQNLDSSILVSSVEESVMLSTPAITESPVGAEDGRVEPQTVVEPTITKDDQGPDETISAVETSSDDTEKIQQEEKEEDSNDSQQQTFTKNFMCNVCDKLFHSMKALGQHVSAHAEKWPYKCEFCLLLFEKPTDLLEHRSSLHGVGKTYVCSACTKEFVYLCNLKQHQEELHPGQQCTHTEEEKGKLRPQNHNSISKDNTLKLTAQEETKGVKKEESEVATDELFTTLKIMASDCGKVKGPDVRMGINQHYPSFKPPPFPYHNRSPAASLASATNFTTHNIPQTFSTAIRCTKCGKSFDNMPELHKHILACANASDKRRYTPKRNPIPLRHFAKGQNGVLSTTNPTNGLNTAKLNQETKMKLLTKRQKKLAQKQGKSMTLSSASATEMFICPHCKREFTMRRSRTKHMAVCPKKPADVKKRQDGIVNENNSYRLKGNAVDKNKLEISAHHKTRLQTGSVKRPAVETIFTSKRSKLIIKEGTEATQEIELPIVRTFNPAMRQYSRMHHSIKEIPIKITIVKPQQAEQKNELPHIQGQEAAASTEQTAAV